MLFNKADNIASPMKYKLLAQKLYKRCQDVQNENERCVPRINMMKKLLRRRLRDVELLKRRLDSWADNWRALPMVAPHPKRKIEQKRGPKPKLKNAPGDEIKVKKQYKQRIKKNIQEFNGKMNTIIVESHMFMHPGKQIVLK